MFSACTATFLRRLTILGGCPVRWYSRVGPDLAQDGGVSTNSSNSEREASSSASSPSRLLLQPDRLLLPSYVHQKCQKYAAKGLRSSQDLEQVLEYMKMCSSFLIFATPSKKVELAEAIFKMLQDGNVKLSTPLYNLLLRIYVYNKHKFLPSEFLQFMKDKGVSPNLNTYGSLIKGYCNHGSISGAMQLLEFMKTNSLPITEHVYAHLVTGYSTAGNLSQAEKVLDVMKENQHRPGNIIYISLLCAYAERGLIDKILEVESSMTVFKSLRTFLVVMDTLSSSGHGDSVKEIFKSSKKFEWATSDLRYLCYGCLVRGELVAPLQVMEYLTTMGAVNETLLVQYIQTAINSGLSVQNLWKQLEMLRKDDLFLEQVASKEIISAVANSHNFTGWSETLPNRGELEPHPWGDRWVSEMRHALSLAYFLDPNFLLGNSILPLVARHCSDGDVKGLLISSYVVAEMPDSHEMRIVYDRKTFHNAGIKMEDYFSSQMQKEMTETELKQLIVFQVMHSKFSAAISTLTKMSDDVFADKKLCKALQESLEQWNPPTHDECWNFMAAALKAGAPVHIFSHIFFCEDKFNLPDILNLPRKHQHISWLKIVKKYQSLHYRCNPNMLLKLWKLLKQNNYTPELKDLKFFLVRFILENDKDISKVELDEIYDLLPLHDKTIKVEFYHVVHLINSGRYEEAMEKFELLRKQKMPPLLTWKKVVCAVFERDTSTGDRYLKLMTAAGHSPDKYMMTDMLNSAMKLKNVDVAERILENIVQIDQLPELSYLKILPLWAELGKIGRIAHAEEIVPEHNQRLVQQAKMVALVVNNNIDDALNICDSLIKIDRLYLTLLLKALVSNGHSLKTWIPLILRANIYEKKLNTHLLFTYLDCDLEHEAKDLTKVIRSWDTREITFRLQDEDFSESSKYLEFLKQCNIPFPDLDTLKQERKNKGIIVGEDFLKDMSKLEEY